MIRKLQDWLAKCMTSSCWQLVQSAVMKSIVHSCLSGSSNLVSQEVLALDMGTWECSSHGTSWDSYLLDVLSAHSAEKPEILLLQLSPAPSHFSDMRFTMVPK